MPGTATSWWYELDAHDRVAAVGGAWDPFARENGAPRATTGLVVGRALWEFVDGIETVHLLRRIIGGVRTSGAPVDVPFRCDGPGIERHMRFHAAALDGGSVRITTELLREAPASRAVPVAAPPVRGMIAMCSWCSYIRMDDGGWLPVAEAAARLGLFSGDAMPAITHGMCARCLQAIEPLVEEDPHAAAWG